MQTYTFNNQSIKSQHINNQAWFCGAEVAWAIGYKNPAEAIADTEFVVVNQILGGSVK